VEGGENLNKRKVIENAKEVMGRRNKVVTESC